MELIAEVTPSPKESFWRKIEYLRGYVDMIDIPESPLGVPKPNSITVSSIIAVRYGIPVIAHIRLRDVNRVSLLSLCQAAKLAGVSGVLLTRGEGVDESFSMTTEDAARIIRRDPSCGRSFRLGSVLSFRYPLGKVVERVKEDFDFFLGILPGGGDPSVVGEIQPFISGVGKKIYIYVIVKTAKNRDIVEGLKQLYVDLDRVSEVPDYIGRYVDGLIVSCPGDWRGLTESLKVLRDVV